MAKLFGKFELGSGFAIEGARVYVVEPLNIKMPVPIFEDVARTKQIQFMTTDRFGHYVCYLPTRRISVRIDYGDRRYVYENIDVVDAEQVLQFGYPYDPTNVQITGGTIDGVNIGGAVPASARFSYLETADGLIVNGLQVIGERKAAIPNASGGGGNTDAIVNAILVAMRLHGLIEET